jgi:hypothetical protein
MNNIMAIELTNQLSDILRVPGRTSKRQARKLAEGIHANLTHHADKPLPPCIAGIPCLVIRWTLDEDAMRWRVQYFLNLPLGDYDIRGEDHQDHQDGPGGRRSSLHAPLGGTTINCATHGDLEIPLMGFAPGDFRVPFRDGHHIQVDAEQLKLPMFVVHKDKVREIIPGTQGSQRDYPAPKETP